METEPSPLLLLVLKSGVFFQVWARPGSLFVPVNWVYLLVRGQLDSYRPFSQGQTTHWTTAQLPQEVPQKQLSGPDRIPAPTEPAVQTLRPPHRQVGVGV